MRFLSCIIRLLPTERRGYFIDKETHMTKWWHLNSETTARQLETDLHSGLAEQAVAGRREKYGPNQLREQKGRTPLRIFIEQFADFMIWVLIGAALVSGFLKEWVDALAIVAIVILNALMGFVQEHRAERSLQALRKLAAPFSRVIRDGRRVSIPSAELVPGDLVELEAGDNIPADGRIVQHTPNFAVLEASLTGESTPVVKTRLPLEERDIPLADRANMIYMGTSVVSGKGRALIAETGMNTELGRIAGMIQSITRETTPLQNRLEQFGKFIVYACFILVAVVFGLELLRGGKLLDMFLTSVSLAVAAIPEGLATVVTIVLSVGVTNMSKRSAVIRRLPAAVGQLGSASVILFETRDRNPDQERNDGPGGLDVSRPGPKSEASGTIPPEASARRRAFRRRTGIRFAGACRQARRLLQRGRACPKGRPLDRPPRRSDRGPLTPRPRPARPRAGLEHDALSVEEIPFDSERKLMLGHPPGGKRRTP